MLQAALCAGIVAALMPLSASAGDAVADGATIENGGSTNAAGWRIVMRSNGQATSQTMANRNDAAAPQPAPAAFSADPALVARFFQDVRAARASGVSPASCMKSASFGSRTVVIWHGWNSGDLSCPGNSGAMGALATDVSQLETAGRVTALPLYRRMPIEIRGTPASSPSPSPHGQIPKDGAPSRQSHRR